ncbi:MAG: hypothetical protein JXA03_13235 [Bacteroidales bacterium]|nr:hypothetical protein [Bacteroidales bacterium]
MQLFNRVFLVFLVMTGMSANLFSQADVKDTCLRIPMFYAAYAFQVPGGDLADRFGVNSNIGGGFLYKTGKNLVLGADFSYMFGSEVKDRDQLMSNLFTKDDYIIDQGGSYAAWSIFERGFYTGLKAGRVIPVWGSNPNSGLLLLGSAGFIQHKIRIEVQNNTAPQLNGDYKRGYDRLTGGFYLGEYLGYQYLGDSRLLNFTAGFEFVQAFTKPLRDVNFDTRLPDSRQNRTDLLFGVKVSWVIPVFSRMPQKYYYY